LSAWNNLLPPARLDRGTWAAEGEEKQKACLAQPLELVDEMDVATDGRPSHDDQIRHNGSG
jgi:hypothetical protein